MQWKQFKNFVNIRTYSLKMKLKSFSQFNSVNCKPNISKPKVWYWVQNAQARILRNLVNALTREKRPSLAKFDVKTGIFTIWSKFLPKLVVHWMRQIKMINTDEFWFYNAAINEIPESVFGDIIFDEISFYQGLNLTKIHSFAFEDSSLTVKEFTLANNDPPDYDLFKMMSSMVNVQRITAFGCYYNNEIKEGSKVSVIPEYAFIPLNGEQKNLTELIFSGECIGNCTLHS